MDRRIRDLDALGLLALSMVLFYALWSQIVENELPCPLCLLQRLGFVGVMAGLFLNLMLGPKPVHYGLASLAALFGIAAALRQTALHIIPGSGVYGAPLLGLHFYVWAFIVFFVIIFGLIVISSYSGQYTKEATFVPFKRQSILCKYAVVVSITVVVLNMLTTFAVCGPLVCADNPTDYWLFSDGS